MCVEAAIIFEKPMLGSLIPAGSRLTIKTTKTT